MPINQDVAISRTKESRARERDPFPQLTELTLQQGRAILMEKQCKNLRMVRRLSLW